MSDYDLKFVKVISSKSYIMGPNFFLPNAE